MLQRIVLGSSIAWALMLSMPAVAQTLPTTEQLRAEEPTEITPNVGVSPAEVEQFARTIRQMRQIQEQAQQQATAVLTEVGLTLDEFNALLSHQQSPSPNSVASITPDTQQRFDRALEQIAQIRTETERQIEQAIESEGLSVARFNQIFALVQRHAELRQAVDRVLRGLDAPQVG